jgi:hypothetical protein
MNRNRTRHEQWRGRGTDSGSPRRRLRPTVTALEGRVLLSTLNVSNINDSGAGSLREAVNQANSDNGPDTINFSDLFNTPQTITLAAGTLTLTDKATTTITGPGANLLTISGGSFEGSSVVLTVVTVTGTAALSGLMITGANAAGDGGGLLNYGGSTTLTGCTIAGNFSETQGGGLANQSGSVTLVDCAVSGNMASFEGGGLLNGGTLSMTNCTVSGNSAFSASGGGLRNDGTATLIGCSVSGNSANYGGGLRNGGTLSLTSCTVSGNSATQSGGGALSNVGSATFTGCTVAGNASSSAGGGLSNRTGTLSLTNCTVTGNKAQGDGGGLINYQNSMLSLTNVTVSANSALNGAGLYNLSGTVTATNTIVAGQNSGGDIQGALTAGSANNLIGDGSNMTGISNGSQGNQVGTFQTPINPLLAPLGDYGGPTLTMALIPRSTATGGGQSGSGIPNTDQRGFARGVSLDIGAFQSQGRALLVNDTTDGVGTNLGRLNLRQAVNLADVSARADMITIDPSLFAGPQTITLTAGALSLSDPASTTINGPGANLLTISGNNASRVFQIASGVAVLSGITITGGSAAYGGGLYNSGGTLTLSNVIISGNSATESGGGLRNYGGMTTLTDVTVVANNSGGNGGGLVNSGGTLTLTNATVTGNIGLTDGGGLDTMQGGTTTLINVTVSGNSSGGSAVGLSNSPDSTTTLLNTIVAGQVVGGDISRNYTDGGHNLVGGKPLLAALGDYGGPTQTMALLPGSPAIGGGAPGPRVVTVDQRGQVRTNRIDIGAFQSQGFTLTPAPDSTPQSAMIGTTFGHPLAVTVAANNPAEPVDGGIISFAAPAAGASATVSTASAVIASGQAGVTATANTTLGSYSVTASFAGVTTPADFALANTGPPLNVVAQPVAAVVGRAFTNMVVATFTVSDPNASPGDFLSAVAWGDGITTPSTTVIADGQGGFKVLGTHTYVDAGSDTFSVQVTDQSSGASATATSTAKVTAPAHTEAASLVLTTHRDVVDAFDGLTSLREAIAYANSHPGPDTITFDPAAFGKTPRTIRLMGGPLVLTDPATTTIIGPGASLLKISGGGKIRAFDIRRGSLALSGVTITGASADLGGGVRNRGGTLVLSNVVIRGNRAVVGGGLFNNGSATLSGVAIKGNRAVVGSDWFNSGRATFHWRRSPVAHQGTARVSHGSQERN